MSSEPESMLDAALRYASWGWPVLPLAPGSKLPATQHGVHDATCDEARIRQWWTASPHANIGIAAGARSGLIILDVDPRNGGDDSWAGLQRDLGALPDTAQALTAGGGEHYLMRYDPRIRSTKLADGVDLLADGRYFVAYPSQVNGRTYSWEASSDPSDGVAPAPLPPSWADAILHKRRAPSAAANDSIIVGNRNAGLTALAGAMRRHGMTEAEILAALTIANETRCEIPLPSSELAQIARSVARYEPASDAAADAALGAQAAQDLLAPEPDWLIPADEFSAQPAPIAWLIRRWLQADSLIMIHGPSGGGKTFVVLDMALHLAAGMADWCGMKVRPCPVVYLAGEGHHGLRSRVAAWKHHHAASSLNMWLSRDGLDLNTPLGYTKVADCIKALPVTPGLIVVDTLHRFLHGDENSAQDAKTMLDACNSLQREFSASVILVHHTGVSEEAQHRARGSSSWRGALDIEISVIPPKDDGPIQLVQRKSKDAELAEPIGMKLTRIEIPGWIDEDGEQVTSAIITQESIQKNDTDKTNRPEKQISREIRTLINAWNHSGREMRNSTPYLSRSALIDHLVNRAGISLPSAKQYTQAGKPNRMISNLITAEIILPHEHGWIVSHNPTASSMMLQKVEEN